MHVNFLIGKRPEFEDKDSLTMITGKLLKEIETFPKSEVKFEIGSKMTSHSYNQLFQGKLFAPLVVSGSFRFICNESNIIFGQALRIEKIWVMLQLLSCCSGFILDNPIVKFEKYSSIINPWLLLAISDNDSVLRQLPNEILVVIAKISALRDIKLNANTFVNAVTVHFASPPLEKDDLFQSEPNLTDTELLARSTREQKCPSEQAEKRLILIKNLHRTADSEDLPQEEDPGCILL